MLKKYLLAFPSPADDTGRVSGFANSKEPDILSATFQRSPSPADAAVSGKDTTERPLP